MIYVTSLIANISCYIKQHFFFGSLKFNEVAILKLRINKIKQLFKL